MVTFGKSNLSIVTGESNNLCGTLEADITTSSNKFLLKKTDILLNETIIVGDSMLDYDVSKALKIDCVLLSNGHNNLERLLATGSKTFSNIQSFSHWILDESK